jgi:hypothetical protein
VQASAANRACGRPFAHCVRASRDLNRLSAITACGPNAPPEPHDL